jgi:hypothetical protein
MWGAGLFWFPTFQLNLVSDKTWHSMKVTNKEGHHHLRGHSRLDKGLKDYVAVDLGVYHDLLIFDQ